MPAPASGLILKSVILKAAKLHVKFFFPAFENDMFCQTRRFPGAAIRFFSVTIYQAAPIGE
jgi:hypothetical protein